MSSAERPTSTGKHTSTGKPSTTGKHTTTARPTATGKRRRAFQLVAALYLASLLGTVALVLGPFFNDRAIAHDPARALAVVTHVGLTRTTVSFQDQEGLYHSPQQGLRYPTGLGEGQKVWVEYQASNPDLVKVQGREWTLAIIPALSVLVVSTLLAAAAWGALHKIPPRKTKLINS